jgi:hypothetical protein
MSFSLQSIQGIGIEVKVEGQEIFKLHVDKSGHVNKFLLLNGKGLMDIYEDHGDYFRRLINIISPSLLERKSGRFEFPEKQGKVCDLMVYFQDSSEQMKSFEFVYGMASKSPPKDIMDLVSEAFKNSVPKKRV